MCGIFGIIANKEHYNPTTLIKMTEDIARFSQIRGKDSSGIAYRFEDSKIIKVLKGPYSIDNLLASKEYKQLKKDIIFGGSDKNANDLFTIFGHARLVTNGTQLEPDNNQPVIKDGFIGIHNGIVANDSELFKSYPQLKRKYEIDTEFILSYLRYRLDTSEYTHTQLSDACIKTNNEVVGTISTAILDSVSDHLILFTNFGSLYILTDDKNIVVFGSEKNILLQLIKKYDVLREKNLSIKQVSPLTGYIIDLSEFKIIPFAQNTVGSPNSVNKNRDKWQIVVENLNPIHNQLHAVIDPKTFSTGLLVDNERNILEYNIERISQLKRCTRCILPETFPFIKFDEKGVCNYCNNYKIKNQPKPLSQLEGLVDPFRKPKGQVDCLIPYSGGRDSTFTLHFVKKVLGLNPIAFTYDWGMVTDLARRNIARVCGKLAVENIIVAADIHKKRENIRKNVSAWLKRPKLGMVPLFMAGDKYFYYYTNEVKKQNDLKLNIWGINPLENTDFKTGYAGVPPDFNKERIFSLRMSDMLRLFSFVGRNFLLSPGYLNQSLLDSFGSIFSRYLNPKSDYYHLFDYYKWDEQEIEDIILNEYEWELAVDTKTTWRIGDGTASFYNYIYYTVGGFSEYETFRSNQIREGVMTREEALKLVQAENIPRYETIKWYLEIIGLEFQSVIKRVNQIPKLY